jgi:hypothetical protein
MKYNTVLITPGACGTTMMAELVGLRTLNNGQFDYRRHRRDPDIRDADHVIYMYSNPYDKILSFHRRGFFSNPAHCQHADGDIEYFMKHTDCTLEEHLKLPIDPFGIEEHFHNYYNFDDRKYNIMFVKYESLENTIPDVLKWLNSSHRLSEFKFKKRNSDWNDQPENIKELLEKKFGNHKRFLDTLPDIFYKNKK